MYFFLIKISSNNRIGQFFDTSIYPNYKYLSIGGDAANNQAIHKILIGSPISHLQDVSLDKNRLKNTMKSLYTEAQDLEI